MEIKEYKIKSVADISRTITPDNFANFMIDFTAVMINIIEIKQSHKKKYGTDSNMFITHYDWKDDSIEGVKSIQFKTEDSSEAPETLVFDHFLEKEQPELKDQEPKIPRTFTHEGITYTEGERVMVSEHYAGYKKQYNFMIGEVYLDDYNFPCVQIEISKKDVEKTNRIRLSCWGKITKIDNLHNR